jgi:AcrR family transcriptional regulator
MPDSRRLIMEASTAILRDPQGPALTLESAARGSGLSKPGLMYHYPTKGALVRGVMEHLVAQWSARLAAEVGRPCEEASSRERIAAYVTMIAGSEFDLADLAVFFQMHYRAEMTEVWVQHMEPWLAIDDTLPVAERSRLMAARLAADGYWFAVASGWAIPDRDAVAAAMLSLTED